MMEHGDSCVSVSSGRIALALEPLIYLRRHRVASQLGSLPQRLAGWSHVALSGGTAEMVVVYACVY